MPTATGWLRMKGRILCPALTWQLDSSPTKQTKNKTKDVQRGQPPKPGFGAHVCGKRLTAKGYKIRERSQRPHLEASPQAEFTTGTWESYK